MKLRGLLILTVLVVFATIAVESSIVVKQSLLRPRRPEPCFSCRAEDRPFAYPLVTYLAKVKDMFVRGLNTLLAKTKAYKLN